MVNLFIIRIFYNNLWCSGLFLLLNDIKWGSNITMVSTNYPFF